MMWMRSIVLALTAVSLAPAQTPGEARYALGTPALAWVWVNPSSGNDAASGASNAPLRTLTEAWNRIPASTVLTGHGYGIALLPGDYPATAVPGWMAARWGTAAAPVIIQSVAGRGTARLHGYLDVFDCRYLYLLDLNIVTDAGYGSGGNALHLASCDHVLLRGCTLDGFDGTARQTQETLKVNQSQYLFVEECDIAGAFWYPLDFVAVQYGHIVASEIHNAGEWCVLLKGGSAGLLVEGNEIYDGATGGFVAGNGTGFEFMTAPWIHYEAEDIKFVNNLIHHTGTAGMGVNGGYNVLLAYNTLYKAGTNDHVIEVVHGMRGCDGDTARCAALNAAGGWGSTAVETQYIPARNVYIYNNLVYIPAGFGSRWQHFAVDGPVTPPAGCNVTNPAVVDANLRIVGNLIWNGPADLALGLGDTDQGGQAGNPTCNATLVLAANHINLSEPQLVDPEHGDYRVRPGTSLGMSLPAIPPFPGDDRAQPPLAPQGNLSNAVAAIDLPYSGQTAATTRLAQAVNQPGWMWTTGGDAGWFAQTLATHDGLAAAQSGRLAAGQQTWLQAATNGPGSVLFWWRASAAAGNAVLEFYVDDQLRDQLTGTTPWKRHACFVGEGAHTFRWRYAKTGSMTAGADAGWVDEVAWLPCPAATNAPVLFFQEPGGLLASWVLGTNGTLRFARVLASLDDWQLTAVGDVDGDGTSDLFLQTTGGDLALWLMNADGTFRSARRLARTGTWAARACAAFSAPGRTELFFQTPAGQTAYWQLDTNGLCTNAVTLGNLGVWRLQAAADLDGDGRAELFWQRPDGLTAVWRHQPDGSQRGQLLGATGAWGLRTALDLDGAGTVDLLWQAPDGAIASWQMSTNGTPRAASLRWNTGGWKLKAAGH